MSKITRTITGDKAGIIAYLAERRDELQKSADDAVTHKYAAAQRAEALGVEWAIRVLEDWEQETP